MKRYAITSNEELRKLCIENDWFTSGTNEQYNKLFDCNSSEKASVEEIAAIIWVCSDDTKEHICDILREKHREYEARFIKSDIDNYDPQTYSFTYSYIENGSPRVATTNFCEENDDRAINFAEDYLHEMIDDYPERRYISISLNRTDSIELPKEMRACVDKDNKHKNKSKGVEK